MEADCFVWNAACVERADHRIPEESSSTRSFQSTNADALGLNADARGVVIRVNPRDIRENPRLSFWKGAVGLRR